MFEKLYANRREVLTATLQHFENSNLPTIKIGCELEFFLLQKNQPITDSAFLAIIISELKNLLMVENSLIYQVEKEQGISQIEIKTAFTDNIVKMCAEIESAKEKIKNFAKNKNLTASFAAQPFLQDCGNALQFNISLHRNQENIFDGDKKSLQQVANKLLTKTNEMLAILAPQQEDYLRFSPQINLDLFKQGKFTAPINLSFGLDNRTCAIRIPKSKNNTRLEYRVASASADLFLASSVIFLAINDQQNCSQEFAIIHGNAFDQQYQASNLCFDIAQAQKLFLQNDNLFRNFFAKKCF